MGPGMSTAAPTVAAPPARRRWDAFRLHLLDNRYPSLHGLRVLAIVSVVQYHVTWIMVGEQHLGLDGTFTNLSLGVFFGMDLFFILSGFLIGSILIRSLEIEGTRDLRRFYARRAFRTFPAYYVVLTALVLGFGLGPGQRQHLWSEYVYLTNFFPLTRDRIVMFWGWSLALEEQFYVAVPLLFLLLLRFRRPRVRLALLAVLWAAGLASRLYVYWTHGPWNDFTLYDSLYFRTPTRFDPLVAGIFLAFVNAHHADAVRAWLRAPFHRAVLGLVALTTGWVLMRPTMFGYENLHLVRVFSWGTLTTLFWLSLLGLLLFAEGWFGQVLGHPAFRKLATLGYGVYLIHIPIIDHLMIPAAHALDEQHVSLAIVWTAALAGVLAASFAGAFAIHLLIEKPSLWLRDRIAG